MTDILSWVLIHRCPSLREEAQLHSSGKVSSSREEARQENFTSCL